MRLVVDTDVLVSASLAPTSLPARLLVLWRQDRFALLTAIERLEELRKVTRYPKIRDRLPPALAGRPVDDLRGLAVMLDRLPSVDVSPDPCRAHVPEQPGVPDVIASGCVYSGAPGLLPALGHC